MTDPLRGPPLVYFTRAQTAPPPCYLSKTIEPCTSELIRILLSRRREERGKVRKSAEKKKNKKKKKFSKGGIWRGLFQLLKFRGWKRPPSSRVYLTLVSLPPRDSPSSPSFSSSVSSSSSSFEPLLTERATIPTLFLSLIPSGSRLVLQTLETTTGREGGGGGTLAKHPREFCS